MLKHSHADLYVHACRCCACTYHLFSACVRYCVYSPGSSQSNHIWRQRTHETSQHREYGKQVQLSYHLIHFPLSYPSSLDLYIAFSLSPSPSLTLPSLHPSPLSSPSLLSSPLSLFLHYMLSWHTLSCSKDTVC